MPRLKKQRQCIIRTRSQSLRTNTAFFDLESTFPVNSTHNYLSYVNNVSMSVLVPLDPQATVTHFLAVSCLLWPKSRSSYCRTICSLSILFLYVAIQTTFSNSISEVKALHVTGALSKTQSLSGFGQEMMHFSTVAQLTWGNRHLVKPSEAPLNTLKTGGPLLSVVKIPEKKFWVIPLCEEIKLAVRRCGVYARIAVLLFFFQSWWRSQYKANGANACSPELLKGSFL